MDFKKIRKRDYGVLTLIIVLAILGAVKISQTRTLKSELSNYEQQLKESELKYGELNELSESKNLLLQIDNLILETLANENSIGIDSLRAMFVNLPVGKFNDLVEQRLNNQYSIYQNMDSKTKKLEKAHSNIKDLLSKNNSLNASLTELNSFIEELEIKNSITTEHRNNLQKSIDSLQKQNTENLHVVELKKNGNTVYFIGSKINGVPNGYGVGLWSTGGVYKGEWKNGLREGKGIYVWKDGEVYEGDWKDGMRTGQGKYVWKDKQSYIGGWQENKRHGFGSVYYPNGKLEYEGQWEKDKFKQPIKANDTEKKERQQEIN
jgi:chaperonin cofactor prefoldin